MARLAMMQAGLVALKPNIVFLQEAFVCPETGDDTAQRLADSLNFVAVQIPAREKLRRHAGADRRSWSNNAILTASALCNHRAFPLTACEGDNDRWVETAELIWAGTPVRLANTHLTHIRSAAGTSARDIQITELAGAAQTPSDGITVLGGDLNAPSSDPSIRRLVNLTDRIAPEIDEVVTTLNEQASPAMSSMAIDHLIVRRGPMAPDVCIKRQFTALDKPDPVTGIYASDHAALVIDIEWPAS